MGSIVRDTFTNYWRVWGIGIIYGLLTLTMILILSIPFVVLILVRWSFKYQVLYLERAGVIGSLNRSAALVKGSWWRVFGIQVLVSVLVLVLAFAMGLMAGLISFIAPGGLPRQAVAGVLSTLTQTVLMPFSAIAITVLYLDQRVRKESLDLQLMAGQVGQAEYAPQAADLPPAGSDYQPPTGAEPAILRGWPGSGSPPPCSWGCRHRARGPAHGAGRAAASLRPLGKARDSLDPARPGDPVLAARALDILRRDAPGEIDAIHLLQAQPPQSVPARGRLESSIAAMARAARDPRPGLLAGTSGDPGAPRCHPDRGPRLRSSATSWSACSLSGCSARGRASSAGSCSSSWSVSWR